jgi:hypothetical protein
MNRVSSSLLSLACTAVVAGCPAVDDDSDVVDAAALTAQAKTNYPRVIDMHQKIVARSCAPNTGVCHNTNNYPELASTSSLVQSINGWCNIASPSPTEGFDMCERSGDRLVSGSFSSEIAHLRRTDDGEGWLITLRDPAPRSDDVAVVRFENASGDTIFQPSLDWAVTIAMTEDDPTVVLSVGVEEPFFTEPFIDDSIRTLVAGDPNENGVFGADAHSPDGDDAGAAATFVPGSLERSYFWGRITGTVPGTRMPLANAALTDDEYVAVACFIEGLPQDGTMPAPEAAIDYDNCAYAKKPVHYALSE